MRNDHYREYCEDGYLLERIESYYFFLLDIEEFMDTESHLKRPGWRAANCNVAQIIQRDITIKYYEFTSPLCTLDLVSSSFPNN